MGAEAQVDPRGAEALRLGEVGTELDGPHGDPVAQEGVDDRETARREADHEGRAHPRPPRAMKSA